MSLKYIEIGRANELTKFVMRFSIRFFDQGEAAPYK